ncbi:MAG: bifunctional DNA-formamidopyrimidine glycosylase/DNA-(apurinic or apyrimidinic site) lyase [Microbacteriaceae bacterium]|nr:bifunctional DNA-formamidopyrimidine glycosylase/DNA-(apurinic or apyrimidinic site) lyase [Microbacteriaceae bacterium]
MPELPEVEVVRRGLLTHLVGARVADVTVFDARALKRHPGSAAHFASTLTGTRIESAVRRGKFVWCPLDSGDALVIHLGMSGQIRIVDGEPIRHERVRLVLDGKPSVAFVDQRLFGSLALDSLVDGQEGFPAGLGSDSARIPSSVTHIARDILDPALDVDALIARFRKRTTGVKVAMLNQGLVSGIGNIYADEALWAARIHYATPADRIRPVDYRRLFGAVREVMTTALDAGGTSFDALYVNVNGESGYFDVSLNAYGQDGKPCARCDTLIVREPWQNRSSHFCPSCQRSVRIRR